MRGRMMGPQLPRSAIVIIKLSFATQACHRPGSRKYCVGRGGLPCNFGGFVACVLFQGVCSYIPRGTGMRTWSAEAHVL